MKRSESVLVYAVTAVLAVILVVAVVFGNEGEAAGPSKESLAGGGLPKALGLGEDGADPTDGFTDVGPGVRPAAVDPGSEDPVTGPAAPELPSQYETPIGPLRASGNVASIASILGPFRAENQIDGTRYRVVEIQRGDTFSELVQKWTGDLDKAPIVRALNESVDPAALRAGEELWVPWVDDAELLLAWQERTASPGAASVSRPAETPRSTAVPAGGEVHEIVKGESLWRIAEQRVGTGGASAYVQAILRANPSIRDASSIRAGEKIVLPPAQ